MREKISAFIDGELEDGEVSAMLQSLEADDSLQEDWRLYHLIGDAMRGSAGVPVSCVEGVSARLAAEPPLTMPEPGQEQRRRNRQRIAANRAWYSIAASVAGVAFVGWAAWQSLLPGTGASVAPQQLAGQTAAPVVREVQPVTYESQVSDYWVAHRQMSGHMAGENERNVQFVSVESSGDAGR